MNSQRYTHTNTNKQVWNNKQKQLKWVKNSTKNRQTTAIETCSIHVAKYKYMVNKSGIGYKVTSLNRYGIIYRSI